MASASTKTQHPLTTACDLWVLPTSEHSRWFARIDWYLNWRMSKGLAHNRPEPSPELLDLLYTNGIEYLAPPNVDRAPLMVAALGRLPASKCVVLEYSGRNLRGWLEKIQELSEQLKSRNARVFLPSHANAKDAAAIWAETAAPGTEVEFSTDEDKIV